MAITGDILATWPYGILEIWSSHAQCGNVVTSGWTISSSKIASLSRWKFIHHWVVFLANKIYNVRTFSHWLNLILFLRLLNCMSWRKWKTIHSSDTPTLNDLKLTVLSVLSGKQVILFPNRKLISWFVMESDFHTFVLPCYNIVCV